jgi:hypothetical protein
MRAKDFFPSCTQCGKINENIKIAEQLALAIHGGAERAAARLTALCGVLRHGRCKRKRQRGELKHERGMLKHGRGMLKYRRGML